MSDVRVECDIHVECVVDFCGNPRSPGHWADVYERRDGTRYILLGGGWGFYHAAWPRSIEDTDPRFAGFLAAALEGDDIAFVRKHFPVKENSDEPSEMRQ